MSRPRTFTKAEMMDAARGGAQIRVWKEDAVGERITAGHPIYPFWLEDANGDPIATSDDYDVLFDYWRALLRSSTEAER